MQTHLMEAEDITVRFKDKTVLHNIRLSLDEGDWLMVTGPNGAGKSTLARALCGAVEHGGTVRLEGRDMRRMPSREAARWMGLQAQVHDLGYAFRVEEVVRLGRYAYSGGLLGTSDTEGKAAVEQALAMTGMLEYRDRSVLELSGGEVQRMFLAQLFAQNPRILLLDEPTNHLDLMYRKQIFDLVQEWRKEPGRAVISVVHDLSLARAYGTRAILLHEGRTAAAGSPEEVFQEDHLKKVFAMDVGEWMRELYGVWNR